MNKILLFASYLFLRIEARKTDSYRILDSKEQGNRFNSFIDFDISQGYPLIAVVLTFVFSPAIACICFWKNKKYIYDTPFVYRITTSKKGLMYLLYFLICSITAISAGVRLCISCRLSEEILVSIFEFAQHSMDGKDLLKPTLEYISENNLREMNEKSVEVVEIIYDINYFVGNKFTEEIRKETAPVIYMAEQIEVNKIMAMETLENLNEQFSNFSKRFPDHIKLLLNQYTRSIDNLINSNKLLSREDTQALLNLKNFGDVSVGDQESKPFEKLMQKLNDSITAKLGVHTQIISLLQRARNISSQVNYDPTPLVKYVRQAIFQVSKEVQRQVMSYLQLIEVITQNLDRDKKEKEIRYYEKTKEQWEAPIYIFHMTGIISVCLICVILVLMCISLCNKKDFKCNHNERLNKVHRKDKVLYYLSFAAINVGCICWICSIYLFLISSVLVSYCKTFKDLGNFKAISHFEKSNDTSWHRGMFTTFEFDSKISYSVEKMQNRSSCFPPVSSVNVKSNFDEVKSKLNTTQAIEQFKKLQLSMQSDNSTVYSSPMPNGTEIAKELKNIKYFEDIELYKSNLSKTNASVIINSLTDKYSNSSDFQKYSRQTLKAYKYLFKKVINAISHQKVMNATLKGLNITLQLLDRQLPYLMATSEIAFESIANESLNKYSDALNRTLNSMIEKSFQNVMNSVEDYGVSFLFCQLLMKLYNTGIYLICEPILFLIASIWFDFSSMPVLIMVSASTAQKLAMSVFINIPSSVSSSEEQTEEDT